MILLYMFVEGVTIAQMILPSVGSQEKRLEQNDKEKNRTKKTIECELSRFERSHSRRSVSESGSRDT